MARIKPFNGIRFNTETIDYNDVVTQPYDKISPALLDEYYQKSEYSTARLILNKAKDPYAEAAQNFQEWQKNKTLLKDDAPHFYAYFQEYKLDGHKKVRRGLVALVGLEEFASRIVLPHERTLSGPKADRLNLLRATKANLEQIFFLYSDPDNEINNILAESCLRAPDAVMTDHFGDTHKLWRVDEAVNDDLVQLMQDKQLLIADGHHRYETACNYAREVGTPPGSEASTGYVMATLINMDDQGLTILPTHRLVNNLSGFNWEQFLAECKRYFRIVDCKPNQLCSELANHKNKNVLGLLAQNKAAILYFEHNEIMKKLVGTTRSESWQTLDVAILHSLILEKILGIKTEEQVPEHKVEYVRSAEKGIERVLKGEKQLMFLLNPVDVHKVYEVARQGDTMPPKSTDFYPKLLSGLVFHQL